LARKPGKHTPYFELVDAQSQAGCPICRLIYKATNRYLDSILWEAVLDPEVRAKLKRSHGFCAEHVEMLSNKSGRALGIALIYRDTIRAIANTAERGQYTKGASLVSKFLGKGQNELGLVKKLSSDEPCPACGIAHKAESNYLDLLIVHLDDEKLYDAYAQGEGLCLAHFIGAIERVEDKESLHRLIRPQVARYRLMLTDLDEFIRKRDHRFRHEKYGKEGDVWLRAMNAIVGGAGLGLSARTGGRPRVRGTRRSSDI